MKYANNLVNNENFEKDKLKAHIQIILTRKVLIRDVYIISTENKISPYEINKLKDLKINYKLTMNWSLLHDKIFFTIYYQTIYFKLLKYSIKSNVQKLILYVAIPSE